MNAIGSVDLEKRLNDDLAEYATKFYGAPEDERKYPESVEETYRTRYRRDRDRIIYCTAFRRLQYKTQVFVNYEGDHYRTRLTHSIEVEQLATSMARALRLNEELVSAIAYGHDLGHTPFGHAVEARLDDLMKDCGGFSHAVQSVKVVDKLAEYRPGDYPGLNLCWAVREGILKHTKFDNGHYQQHDCSDLLPNAPGSLEAQLVFHCDRIAYVSHDLDDAIRCGLLNEDDKKELRRIRTAAGLTDSKKFHVRDLIRMLTTDFMISSKERLEKAAHEKRLKSSNDARNWDEKESLLGFQKYESVFDDLRQYLSKSVYGHPYIAEADKKARNIIEILFERYAHNLDLLPQKTWKTMRDPECTCPRRVIVDHIAGMTDRYATEQFKKLHLFVPYPETRQAMNV